MAAKGIVILLMLCVGGSLLAEPSGEYEVAALRRSSEVQSTPDINPELLGKKAIFGQQLQWIDDTECDRWSLESLPEPVLSLEDPILSDLFIGSFAPSTVSESINSGQYSLNCDAAERRIATLIEIDSHLLVTTTASGALNVVLQKPYSAVVISRVQTALAKRELYDGEITGAIDDSTRIAVASFAESMGAHYRFRDSVISEGLLDLLGISTADE